MLKPSPTTDSQRKPKSVSGMALPITAISMLWNVATLEPAFLNAGLSLAMMACGITAKLRDY